jgi:hypothetical protein
LTSSRSTDSGSKSASQLALARLGIAGEGLRGLGAGIAIGPCAAELAAVELLLDLVHAWSVMGLSAESVIPFTLTVMASFFSSTPAMMFSTSFLNWSEPATDLGASSTNLRMSDRLFSVESFKPLTLSPMALISRWRLPARLRVRAYHASPDF